MKVASWPVIVSAFVLMAVSFGGVDKTRPRSAKPDGQVWDSGTFGIFVSGKRLGTEKFQIERMAGFSVASSEFQIENGNFKADQKSEMEITPSGDLRSYIWQATSPQKEECVVDLKDQFLIEHITPADQKKLDIQHLLPASTAILDDNFFSQRELLLWRYLATACPKRGNQLTCRAATFPVLVPQEHVSEDATLELLGQEQVMINGAKELLNKIRLRTGEPQKVMWLNDKGEESDMSWLLWVDEDYKLVKMTAAGSNVEVIRDAGRPAAGMPAGVKR